MLAERKQHDTIEKLELSQHKIITKLKAYCKMTRRHPDFLGKKEGGYCFGLSVLFLCAHRQTYSLKQSGATYSWEWLLSVITKLAAWDEKTPFDETQEVPEIERLFTRMREIQEEVSHNCDDLEAYIAHLCGMPITEKYSLAGNFTAEDFTNPITLASQPDIKTTLLDVLVKENRFVIIGSHNHALALFKHNDQFYFFDASARFEICKKYSIDQTNDLVKEFFLSTNKFDPKKPSPLGFFIFGFEEKPTTYPPQKELLSQLSVAQYPCLYDPTYIHINADGMNVLTLSAKIGAVASFQYHLQHSNTSGRPDKYDGLGMNPLHWAAARGQNGIISVLLEDKKHSQLINTPVQGTAGTALTLAVINGHSKTVALLLKHGAYFKQTDAAGVTLLSAAAKGYSETVALLLEHGADIQQTDAKGFTWLQNVACKKERKAVKILLSHLPIQPADKTDDPHFTALINTIYQIPTDNEACFELGVSILSELMRLKSMLTGSLKESKLKSAGTEIFKTAYQTACELLKNPNQSTLENAFLEPLTQAIVTLESPTPNNLTSLRNMIPKTYGTQKVFQQFFGALILLVGVASMYFGLYPLGGLMMAGGTILIFKGKEKAFAKSLTNAANNADKHPILSPR